MTIRETAGPMPDLLRTLFAGIFDVDGVLLASPHERAWREALHGFAEPGRFTTAMYQAHVAGKPRLVGAVQSGGWVQLRLGSEADSRKIRVVSPSGPTRSHAGVTVDTAPSK